MDDADDGRAVLDQRDRDADRGQAVQEVRGPVERVDEPAERRALAAALLAEERDAGRGHRERVAHRDLARRVDVADPVSRRLAPDVAPRTTESCGDDLASGASRVLGRAGEVREIECGHPAAARRLRSSGGVPAATRRRRALGSAIASGRSSASITTAPASRQTSAPPR